MNTRIEPLKQELKKISELKQVGKEIEISVDNIRNLSEKFFENLLYTEDLDYVINL